MALVFAVIHLYSTFEFLFLLSIPFFILFFNLVLMVRQSGRQCQRVLALCAFFKGGSAEGTSSLRILCVLFVYVLLYVGLCQD